MPMLVPRAESVTDAASAALAALVAFELPASRRTRCVCGETVGRHTPGERLACQRRIRAERSRERLKAHRVPLHSERADR
jgi:hypothetical protein